MEDERQEERDTAGDTALERGLRATEEARAAGRHGEARRLLGTLRATARTPTTRARILDHAFDHALELGEVEAAAALLEELEALGTGEARPGEAPARRARLAEARGAPDEALAAWSEARRADPAFALDEARLRLEQGQPERVEPLLRQARRAGLDDPRLDLLAARAALAQGAPELALHHAESRLEHLRAARAPDAEIADALLLRAGVHQARGAPAAALAALEEAHAILAGALGPDHPEAQMLLSWALALQEGEALSP